MSLSLKFTKARLSTMALARVGNPLRDEPLLTSKSLCRFDGAEAELLTKCFLKPFRSLDAHRLNHHSGDLSQNAVFAHAAAIFADPETLLERAEQIAMHLHGQSKHPNIKPGDLCTTVIEDIGLDGKKVRALAIIKSESKVPFLQISIDAGDLRLRTEEGIYPDKIDKGALIVDHGAEEGYLVYMFDKSGGKPHFWNRDFLGAAPREDSETQTKAYTDLCVAFAEKGLPESTPQEDRIELANKALAYMNETDTFDPDEFRAAALDKPEVSEQFEAFKSTYEEERGEPIRENFTVAKPVAEKARKRMKGKMKFDTGAQVYFSSNFLQQSKDLFQRGFDEQKKMKFVKIFYNEETE
jgi:hypothetical protein